MKQQLLLHCGGREASLDDLKDVPLPKETKSYKPVSHYDLTMNIRAVAGDMLHDYHFSNGMYALTKDGNRMFGVHVYQTDEPSDMGLSIGLRNSYDKSMSVGVAIGASIFVCDNLAFTGKIAILRKHTECKSTSTNVRCKKQLKNWPICIRCNCAMAF